MRTAWIVLAPFWCMPYIEDTKYTLGYRTQGIMTRSCSIQNDVSFVQILSTGNRTDLKLHAIVAINTVSRIGRGEELYVKSSIEYIFSRVMSTNKKRLIFI